MENQKEINEIEVIDAECIGTCEVCECNKLTYKDSDIIEFEASVYHETEKAIRAYYIKSSNTSWNSMNWFSRKFCNFSEIKEGTYTHITIQAPVWYLNLLKIEIDKLTLIK